MEFEKIQEIIASVLKIEPELITLEKSFEDDLGAEMCIRDRVRGG